MRAGPSRRAPSIPAGKLVAADPQSRPPAVSPPSGTLSGKSGGLGKDEVRYPGAFDERGRDLWNASGGASFTMPARASCHRLLALPPDAEALPAAHAGGNRVMLMQYSVRGPGDFFTLPRPYAACTTFSCTPEIPAAGFWRLSVCNKGESALFFRLLCPSHRHAHTQSRPPASLPAGCTGRAHRPHSHISK